MGTATKIQWASHTFNPWRGCAEVHAGCDNCYARELAQRDPAVLGRWGADGTRVVASESYWRLPAKWNRAAESAGVRARVFCASLADVFENWRGPVLRPDGSTSGLDLWRIRDRLFHCIDATPHMDWMLLTKRPQNAPAMWPDASFRRNVWLYASVSDQATLDAMMPALTRSRDLVPVLGLSAEPLLGPLDLSRWLRPMHRDEAGLPPATGGDPWFRALDHVIVGGESGPHSRPCRVEWIRRAVSQCRAAGVAVFVKQMGASVITRNDMVEDVFNSGHHGWPDPDVEYDIHGFREQYQGADCRIRLRDPKGGDPTEWPADLQVRELPEARQ